MRIAYISYEYPPDSANGGIATYIGQISRVMADRGHEVEVFASSPLREEMVNNNGIIEHWIRETDTINFGKVVGQIFAKRHKEKPFDLIEGPEYMADARMAHALAPDVALVVKMHTPTHLVIQLSRNTGALQSVVQWAKSIVRYAVTYAQSKIPLIQRLLPNHLFYTHRIDQMERAHAMSADIVGPPCRELCDYASNRWKITQSKIVLSPHPYVPASQYLNLEAGGSGFTVGFVGRLEKRKGIEFLFQSIAEIVKNVPQARFRLVGAVSSRPGTKFTYEEWFRKTYPQLIDKVEFVGKVPLEQLHLEYNRMSVVVIPSIWENFPNVCLEAMSAGRAIVGSNRGGMAEMLDGGKVGKLIDPFSTGQIAAAVIEYLGNSDLRKVHGEAARERVLSAYNVDVIGRQIEEMYQKAMENAAIRIKKSV